MEVKTTFGLDGLIGGDTKFIRKLYNNCLPPITRMIVENSGQIEDAEDVLQDALVTIYRRARKGELQLTCELTTYIYSVCKNMWLSRLRQIKKSNSNQVFLNIAEDSDLLELISENERYKLYKTYFKKLNPGCQRILELYVKRHSMKSIAAIMGYDSINYVRKKKFACKQNLIKKIKSDRAYLELTKTLDQKNID